ncbi:DUF222 domain-containing protein [Microbacterium sp. NPDC089695]|uniref:HNH endonuclease signature motif containing protein n=1 Tax=Microbacterium sp. NPDC089695 TaxID=3364198 RepID=UPI0037F68BE5
MPALHDATTEQIGALAAVTEMLVEVERTLGSVQAARDGLLALGARIAVDIARAADDRDGGDMATRAVAAEFGAALRASDRTMQRRMADADLLVTLFPRIWQAQGAGILSAAHARAIVDAGLHIRDDADRDAYAGEMIDASRVESPNRVARLARRTAERFQRRTIDERHREAGQERAIWVKDRADGMSELGLLGPSVLVHGAFQRITAMAKTVLTETATAGDVSGDDSASPDEHRSPALHNTAPDDERTLAQVRCDVMLDLMLSGAPLGHDSPDGMLARIGGSVSVTVPALTLMGASTVPAEIDGHTPIDTATAKRLAGAASGWDRVLTHPVTGALLAVDRYRPSAEMRRHLLARDQRCRFPTCGQRARDNDLDHSHDHALGGATSVDNLAVLCRRHHSLKHHTPWHVRHRGGGVLAWTSPAGHTYIDAPPPPNTVTTRDPVPPPF